MKVLQKLIVLGLLAGLMPLVGFGELTSRQKNTLLGKFYVSSVKGVVTCASDGRVIELKKGDVILARGTVLETAKDANVTIVFSNQTAVFTDEKTKFTVEKFDQEFFAPNNNLRVEPSNSSTIVRLSEGRLVINTPRLLSGTTMVYQTEHAAIFVKGEKVLIEGDEKQTHVAIISGNASVNIRDKDGVFVAMGKRLKTGQEAFVKKTLASSSNDKPGAGVQPGSKPAPAGSASAAQSPGTSPAAPTTKGAEAVVLRLTGVVHVTLPGTKEAVAATEGMTIPLNATVFTEESSEVLLQPFSGAVATLRPKSRLQIEKLSVTSEGSTVKKRTALFDLKAGTLVSTLDPAKRPITDYGVRTPKGIATARGTSFSVSVEGDSASVATTADTVNFVSSTGVEYTVTEGNVLISPPGRDPQPPISLANAVSANPAFAATLLEALASVSNIVQANLGGLSSDSATILLARVAHTVAAALPNQAASIATQVIQAVNSPSSATAENATAASAAMVIAIVSAVPDQAVLIATTAAAAAPGQAIPIAAAAAKAAPTQAPQIAAAVTKTFVQLTAQGSVSDATVQNAAALAAAVTTSAPDQAAPVAAAVMQTLLQAAPQTPPLAAAQNASIIAAAVTTAAPTQAVPVAALMMRILVQSPIFNDATPQVIGQTAATLAAAVTTVVPPQAQEVATAVMQVVVQTQPNASAQVLTDTAGLIAATVSQVAPDQTAAITQGVAGAANLSVAAVTASAAQAAGQAALIGQQLVAIKQVAITAAAQADAADAAVETGAQLAAGSASGKSASGDNDPTLATVPGATSIIISQFDPGTLGDVARSLDAAQEAQSGVLFDTTTGPNGEVNVLPVPVVPSAPPVEFQQSPANK